MLPGFFDKTVLCKGHYKNNFYSKNLCSICLDMEPNKPYTQVCHDCGNNCWGTRYNHFESSMWKYSVCDMSCNGCDNVAYSQINNTCTQRQCDRPNIWGGNGNKVIRKTVNPGNVILYNVSLPFAG